MRTLSKTPTISTNPVSPPENQVVIGPHTLYHGDCLQVLKSLPDCSVDSVVTDPPAGIGFMGKEWDTFGKTGGISQEVREKQSVQWRTGLFPASAQPNKRDLNARENFIAFLREVMIEVLRVLKPGGHALVWALPRTSHWTATACEDAGFEIRDRVSHIFGTGFPKSMSVSKAIDAHTTLGGSNTRRLRQANNERPGEGRPRGKAVNNGILGQRVDRDPIKDTPSTVEAAQWEGWGTALKPACEDWWLCRKPLEGTVAANVLKYGTGGLNIDACRVEFSDETDKALAKPAGRLTSHGKGHLAGPKDAQEVERSGFEGEQNAKGRFPANLIHDGSEEVLAEFEKYGDRKSCTSPSKARSPGTILGGSRTQGNLPMDSGSAARFFYCTKASKKDRNEGGVANKHPTVKNTELMRYLCLLITPPGGLVLDPFAGSFSTGKAAIKEGFRFIGIEAEREYFEIGVQRIRHEVEKGVE